MKIENKEIKMAKTGAQYAVFTIDGKKLNTFDESLISGFHIGEQVLIKTEKKGEYENLVSMEKAAAVIPGVPVSTIVSEGISRVEHVFQSSYEFGPAGNRHTVKYHSIDELKARIKEIQDAGLMGIE